MTRKHLWAAALAAALSVSATALSPRPALATLPVFDGSNFSQNLLTAARALQQINNQIQSLQNEAVMLENMARNLASQPFSALDGMVADLQKIGGLINQAQGIAFTVDASTAAFAQQYPQQYAAAVSNDQLLADARQRWQNAMSAFQQTLTVQAGIAQTVQSDTATLTALVSASQGAAGNLQAEQTGNQLTALAVKQMLQIQTLMAAQYRADALDRARIAAGKEQARAAYLKFLGAGNAYRPQ
ncbi:MAG TPA: P-type conjugative transfer protein TrbJ [Stellaceae bacterium]|jgi:P-type conjugative transfer protein TrbJ|nr:P-type conjugative transfer protein TrbJ [Stellaceae bacterium]